MSARAMLWLTVAATAWMTCGFVAIGFQNAADLHDHCNLSVATYLRQNDHVVAASLPLTGPIGLFMSLGYSNFGRSGWTLRRDCP